MISLFLPGIKADFALGDADVSLLFSAATLASAVAVWKIGAIIDRADVVRYSLSCGAFLALSCVLVATAQTFIMLAAGMFCLRLAGNGLLTHVALTATARYFTRDRGQALSLVLLGSSIGEAILPAFLVALISYEGWRWTLGAAGCFGLVLVIAAVAGVRKNAAFRSPNSRVAALTLPALPHSAPRPRTDQRSYFALTAALFLAMPMVITATVFHQAVVAEAKGVSLQWFALSFIAFPISRVASSIATGRFVDRIGSRWLFSLHLVPLIAGTVALIVVSFAWIVPIYWLCAGVTSGVGGVVQNTVIAERVTLDRIGASRSVLAAGNIVASALGPPLFGLGLAAGADMLAILWTSVAGLIVATLLAFAAAKVETKPG